MIEVMRRELSRAAGQAEREKQSLTVSWLSTNAARDVQSIIEQMRSVTPKPIVQVLCHDNQQNRDDLRNFPQGEKRFFHTGGHIKLLIVGDSAAFLGVQMGNDRQEYFPDYLVIVQEPVRIGELQGIFDKCWEVAAE